MIKYALGIDISMKSFHVCLSSIDYLQQVKVKSTTSFTNNLPGFKLLHQWIQKHYKDSQLPLIIAMEATGVYYEQCAMFLFKLGYSVAIILPTKAKRYLQATGIKSKNDKIDSKGLSKMAAEQALELWQPMDSFFYELRSLTRQHQSLQELKTSIGNQLHGQEHSANTSKVVSKQLKRLILNIDKQIEEINLAIHVHINTNKEIAHKVDQLCSIKGLGILTVATIIAETNGFVLFKNIKQLVSYSGYDVVENQSGKHVGKTRISKKGNGRIRRALHMSAFIVVQYQVRPFIDLFERTLERHSIKMKSYVAVQKKLLIMIYTLWNSNKKFDCDHYQKISADQKPALNKVISRQNIAV